MDNLMRDNRDNDYERRLKAEVTRLQDALDAEKRRWEAERRSMADRVREEVERRLRSQEEESRRHIAALNDEIRRLNDEARSKIETLVSENVKLQRNPAARAAAARRRGEPSPRPMDFPPQIILSPLPPIQMSRRSF